MLFCPHFNRVAYRETVPGTVVMFRLRCKSWNCEYCAKINRSEWQKHLNKMIPRVSSNWWFLTITAHEKTRTAELSLNNIRSNMDRLWKRVRRVWSDVQFVRTYELHKKGAYHVHAVLSGLSGRVQKAVTKQGVEYYRPAIQDRASGNIAVRTWFRRTCRSLGMGYEVDVKEVSEVGKVTRYIIKYLTKASAGNYAKGLRRVQTSRKVGSPKKAAGGDFITDSAVFLQKLPVGTTLYDADRKLQVPPEYWDTHLSYPTPGA